LLSALDALTAPTARVARARLALDGGLLDAERIIAMLRTRGYAVRRLVIAESAIELEIACLADAAAALLEPRLRRLQGPRLLGAVELLP
jgi:hypothetical protein